jgi:hypothetical protein
MPVAPEESLDPSHVLQRKLKWPNRLQGNRRQKWKRVLAEASDFPGKVRVHLLSKPIRTGRFRIVVTEVAPLDGEARLLQAEAWGR